MFIDKINKWFSKYRKSLVIYKNGFFYLNYVRNSPHDMIASFEKMLFVKHDKATRTFHSKTPFLNTTLKYAQIDDDLFILVSHVKVKANLRFKHIIKKNIPAEYYHLTLQIKEPGSESKNLLVNNNFYGNKSWLLSKPSASIVNYYFKGMESRYFSIYFTKKWLTKFLNSHNKDSLTKFKKFLDSDLGYIICNYNEGNQLFNQTEFTKNIALSTDSAMAALKKNAAAFTLSFAKELEVEREIRYSEMNEKDRLKLLKAETILVDNIFTAFPGIDELSENVGVSPTKLKTDFKRAFGKTIFKYYQEKQMNAARAILKEKKSKVKEVASSLGYENPGKFTATYKKYFGELPSEI